MTEKLNHPVQKALDNQIKKFNYSHCVEKPHVIEMSVEAYEALTNELGIAPHFYKGSMIRVINSAVLEKFDKEIKEYEKYVGHMPNRIQMTKETLDTIEHELSEKYGDLCHVPSRIFYKSATHNESFLYRVKVEII